jgi:para-nitrobenzyl esterase
MPDTIAQTTAGLVRGITEGGISRFLGIPYAAPPVGPRRFAKPQPPVAWDGVRDATAPGPNAPQRVRAVPDLDVVALVGNGWHPGDDYLSLNIWRPAGDVWGAPVMVFIHGGGFVIGSKDAPVQEGAAFARDGVVLVAINYRMGTEGFLPIPGIPTNLGLRDQIAALEWVQQNIAAFGGDPANVTIFGESAGAMSVASLLVSPLAKGLFRRVIVESGHGSMTRSIGIAQRLVSKLAKVLKITPDVDGFGSLKPEEMLKAMEKVSAPTARLDLRDATGREPVFGISRFIPVHGDDVLPVQPLTAIASGAGADIDMLIGTNAEEMNLYFVPTGVRDKVGRLLATYVVHKSQPHARKILKAYGMERRGVKPGHAMTNALHDLVFRWPARRFAEEHRGRTHMYEFEWRSPRFDGQLGASHGMEIAFVFDTLACATGADGLAGTAPPQALADRIHNIWVGYARDGALPWPEFDRITRQVYQLEKGVAIHEPTMPAAPFMP